MHHSFLPHFHRWALGLINGVLCVIVSYCTATNSHNLSSFNNADYLFFTVLESENQEVSKAMFVLKVSGRNPFFFLFQILETACIPWVIVTFSIFKVHHFKHWFYLYVYFFFTLILLSPPLYKNFCDYIGSIEIIQENFSTSISKFCKPALQISANFIKSVRIFRSYDSTNQRK